MKPSKEELEILRIYALVSHLEDKYVWLRRDEEGTYIEYAFKEGVPHDNRCLSWYYSVQPEAIKRNCLAFGDTLEKAQKEIDWREKKVEKLIDGLYTLSSFTCGYEENPIDALAISKKSWDEFHKGEEFIKEDHICIVGKPSSKCLREMICSHWTYKEPVKCACWNLYEIDEIPKFVSIPIEDAIRLKEELIKK